MTIYLSILYTALVASGTLAYSLSIALKEAKEEIKQLKQRPEKEEQPKKGKNNIDNFNLHSRKWDIRKGTEQIEFRCKKCDEAIVHNIDHNKQD